MTDLHSHILPGLDDGAKNAEDSETLLRAELQSGVNQLALTPHFHFEREDIASFCRRRDMAQEKLVQRCPELLQEAGVKKGAEVFFSPSLLEADLRPLCLEGTDLLLVELPVDYRPKWAEDILYRLGALGIVPLIAHVERYPYVAEDPNLLLAWIENGAYIQANASSLMLHKKRRAAILKMIRHGLVHVIATDTHSMGKRPPLLKEAMRLVCAKCGEEKAKELAANAGRLYKGEQPKAPDPEPFKRIFGRYI